MDFKGEPINWLMVAIPFGRSLSLSSSHFYCPCNGVNERKSEQGGDFALFRKLGALIDKQLVMRGTGGHCSISPRTPAVSGISEGKESLKGTSSQVDETCQFRQEGRII